MQVETYEVISLDEQNGSIINEEVSEEALALIESLGLEGQKALVHKTAIADDEMTEQRMPYREMTLEEQRVFGTLFPQRTAIDRYAAGPIPLRALQVAAHANSCGVERIEVWHSRIPAADPVLVGYTKHPTRSWGSRTMLLARWGTALDSFDTLRQQATETLRTKVRSQLEAGKAQVDAALTSVDALVALHLLGEEAVFPSLRIDVP